ncbi:RICIN domain-containing protein [Streptomyces sp. NWU339]|uniref:RICIN domain-containing protein n=1 Tax=Streptomyces sp. NWU339 TaxID=2185284 RepID=UPI0015E7FF3B|nr:RICIN domain-containing protein [Streptomyces sp. NWU339]
MRKISTLLMSLLAAISFTLVSSGTANAAASGILAQTVPGAGNCATPKGNSTANGTIITTWDCTGDPLQQWSIDNSGYIRHKKSGKCLTPSGNASGTNGAVLTLWTCTNDSSQRFVDGWDQIWTQYGGKCITNKGDNLGNGVYLTLWTCGSNPVPSSQRWGIF